MRKWGIVITIFYILILCLFLLPAWFLLVGDQPHPMSASAAALSNAATWIPVTIIVSGQALLLFLSVDTSQKRLRPRTHIGVTAVVTGMFLAMLSCAVVFSLVAAIGGDNALPNNMGGILFLSWGILWLFWGVVFYLFSRDSSESVTRATSWLLRGSVLELIIAVVSHVIVRRRNDCSAPFVTSFGIVTGIAIMLLSFGPSVLFLLKKRMDARAPRSRPAS